MKIRELSIAGAFEVTPALHRDSRGVFLEFYKSDDLAEATGSSFRVAQANLSTSIEGVVRGVHFAAVPPGQAKQVTCITGSVLDVVVDLRVGSPTFGRWESVTLDDTQRQVMVLAEGLGHAFCSLTPDATVMYLTSTSYEPTREHVVNALDPELDLPWSSRDPVMSPRDAAAPTLAEARAAGLLPRYEDCRSIDELRA